MVILVRCTDQTVSVALASRLESLISEGLITEYLGSDGWVAARCKKPSVPAHPAPVVLAHPAPVERGRCTALVSCF